MLLGEILRNNYDIERIDVTIKTLELFMRLDYLQAETDLERVLSDSEATMDTSSVLAEIEERIVEHLVFILHEYGFVLNEDFNASMSELYTLVSAIEDLTKYESPEELLDLMESQDDVIERLVEALSLIVKDTITGNVYDYYNIVKDVTEEFWTKLTLVLDGAREDIVDFDRKTETVIPPDFKGEIWDWISVSGRTGYNLQAAFTLLSDRLEEMLLESPTQASIKVVSYELRTLVHYSSSEDKSEELILSLFEALDPNPDTLLKVQGILPYVELRFD